MKLHPGHSWGRSEWVHRRLLGQGTFLHSNESTQGAQRNRIPATLSRDLSCRALRMETDLHGGRGPRKLPGALESWRPRPDPPMPSEDQPRLLRLLTAGRLIWGVPHPQQ